MLLLEQSTKLFLSLHRCRGSEFSIISGVGGESLSFGFKGLLLLGVVW